MKRGILSAGEPGGGLFIFSQDLEIWKKYNVNKGLGIIGVIYYTEKKEKKLLGRF